MRLNRFLDEYYHSDNFSHNPFKIAEKQTVSVQIDSILQLSPRSYQVRWTEQQRDLNGVAVGSPSHWEVGHCSESRDGNGRQATGEKVGH